MNEWTYKGKVWEPPKDFSPDDAYGFVYIITNTENGMQYVGKKFFWKSKILPITKTRKRRKRTLVESDWKEYHGSNRLIKESIEDKGTIHFDREILYFGKAKGELAYIEAREQFEREVLLDDNYYNGIISCRIGSPSVKNLKKKFTST